MSVVTCYLTRTSCSALEIIPLMINRQRSVSNIFPVLLIRGYFIALRKCVDCLPRVVTAPSEICWKMSLSELLTYECLKALYRKVNCRTFLLSVIYIDNPDKKVCWKTDTIYVNIM